jgi:hypothetical protein
MKFVKCHPFADPDAAARKIIEIANCVEAAQDSRIFIERVVSGGRRQWRGIPCWCRAHHCARLVVRHESGTYVKFTDNGAAMFA